MVVKNADNGGWVVVAETSPSGVSSVVHTGMEDYDWVIAEVTEVELSTSASLIYLEVGYGATPTYATHFSNQFYSTIFQEFGAAKWQMIPLTQNANNDFNVAYIMPNMGRNFATGGSDPMKTPVIGYGWGTQSVSINASTIGTNTFLKEPITALRFTTFTGNMQGTGATIRTWGWRG